MRNRRDSTGPTRVVLGRVWNGEDFFSKTLVFSQIWWETEVSSENSESINTIDGKRKKARRLIASHVDITEHATRSSGILGVRAQGRELYQATVKSMQGNELV